MIRFRCGPRTATLLSILLGTVVFIASAGCSSTPTSQIYASKSDTGKPATRTVTGRAKKVVGDALVVLVSPTGKSSEEVTLTITKETRIVRGGRLSAVGDVMEGETVTTTYAEVDGSKIAKVVVASGSRDARGAVALAEEEARQRDLRADQRTRELLRSYKEHVTRYSEFERDFSVGSDFEGPYLSGSFRLSSTPGLLRFVLLRGRAEGSSLSSLNQNFTGTFVFGRYIVNGSAVRFSIWDLGKDRSRFEPAVYLEFSQGTLTSLQFLSTFEL